MNFELKKDLKLTELQAGKVGIYFIALPNNAMSNDEKSLDQQLGGCVSSFYASEEFSDSKAMSVKTLSAHVKDKIFEVHVLKAFENETDFNQEKNVEHAFSVVGAKILKIAQAHKHEQVFIAGPDFDIAPNGNEIISGIILGLHLQNYNFSKYKTVKKAETETKIFLMTSLENSIRKTIETSNALAEGMKCTKNYINEPPNVLYPESYADMVKEELSKVGVEVEILDDVTMKKMGMNAIVGVGQGSARKSRMVLLKYNGAQNKSEAPLAFVGKGVTFDTGGISIKPSFGMEDMKYDMGGSAVVVGLIKALALRKAKVNVVGAIGLAENMPGGNAQRPSDIVKSYSGQTIEILNTDAEGRLVLADVLWYTKETFKPKIMINLATLTGAIIVALGDAYAGLFSNDDELSKQLTECGESTHERLWRLPLCKEYDKMIDSPVADMQNITNNRGAGSSIAGQFLKRFVGDTKWAHLDIAAVTWSKKPTKYSRSGPTAFGVKLLNKLVAKYYEQ